MSLGDIIKDKNKVSNKDGAKAMIFSCHHFDKVLKIEFLTIKDSI